MANESTPAMKPARAAVVWVLTERIIKGVEKLNEQAAQVLKDHCRSKRLTSYRGIGYSKTFQDRLSVPLARAALGPSKTAECTRPVMYQSLSLPESAMPIVPAELT